MALTYEVRVTCCADGLCGIAVHQHNMSSDMRQPQIAALAMACFNLCQGMAGHTHSLGIAFAHQELQQIVHIPNRQL